MPFLIPPSDFTPLELSERRIIGTCETQICRSCGPWSIGTPSKIEHSIQTAYVKAIELSDHFVYIENQFFITSCIVEGTVITNQIGDALVNRIIKAHSQRTAWKAIIIIPTMPGYPSPLNEDAAGSVRLIVECQNRSICRGETSIFSRLRAEGIDPNNYITFFSLRGWGKLKNGQLTTEGVYIHAKAMIVDDRLVIIGSANINERSQRGDRDSELACVIRDTDMMDGSMGGKPYKVGRFAHTMRVRLMREHVGVDVDALEAEEANMDLIPRQVQVQDARVKEKHRFELEAPMEEVAAKSSSSMVGSDMWDPDREQRNDSDARQGVTHVVSHRARAASVIKSLGNDIKDKLAIHGSDGLRDTVGESIEGPIGRSGKSTKDLVTDQAVKNPQVAQGKDQGDDAEHPASALVVTLEEKIAPDDSASPAATDESPPVQDRLHPMSTSGREAVNAAPKHLRDQSSTVSFASENASTKNKASEPTASPRRNPSVSISEPRPLSRATSHRSGDPQPDTNNYSHPDFLNSPPTAHAQHFPQKGKVQSFPPRSSQFTVHTPLVEIDPNGFEDPLVDSFFNSVWLTVASRNTQILRKVFKCVPDDNVTTWQKYKEYQAWETRHTKPVRDAPGVHDDELGTGGEGDQLSPHPQRARELSATSAPSSSTAQSEHHSRFGQDSGGLRPVGASGSGEHVQSEATAGVKPRKKSVSKADRKANSEEGFSQVERDQMEEILKEVQGHLGQLSDYNSSNDLCT